MARRRVANQYRRWVMDRLKPLLPSGWKVIPYTGKVDALTGVTVLVQLQTVERLPEAPRTHHLSTYTLTIVDPASDPSEADQNLDDETVDLLHALDITLDETGTPFLRWSEARRVTFSDQFLAFDITVTAVTTATENKE